MTRISLVLLCLIMLSCKSDSSRALSIAPSSIRDIKSGGELRGRDGLPFTGDFSTAIVTRDGSFALLEVARQVVAVFDSTGAQVSFVGGRGQGPGEFMGLEAVFSFRNDTLAAFDRQRQSIYKFKSRELSENALRFDQWQLDSRRNLRLVGRFQDGRWLGLLTPVQSVRTPGTRVVSDEPALVIGLPDQPPSVFMKLGPRRALDISSGRELRRIALDEVSPAVGAVCDRGIVVVDTTGVRYIDDSGRSVSQYPIPTQRYAIGPKQRQLIAQRALEGIADGPITQAAASQLLAWLSAVDSVLNQPLIDAEGRAWMSTWIDPEVVQVRFDRLGKADGVFRVRGPAVIGRQSLLALRVDSGTEEVVFDVFRIPTATTSPNIGWCSAPFRF